MATVQVKAELRTAGTKGHARRLRMGDRIPAILYGEAEESVPIALEAASFELMLRRISSGNAILDLKVEGHGKSDYKVLIKDVQRNPVDMKILHVDLQHISMTQKVRVQVPVHLTGTALGVKEGGILEHILREIEVECLPLDIPEHVVLDVSGLDRGNSIHVRQIEIPKVHILESPERVVVTVVAKMKEEEVAAVEVAAPAEGEAPAAEEGSKEAAKEPAKGAAKEPAKGPAKGPSKGPAKGA